MHARTNEAAGQLVVQTVPDPACRNGMLRVFADWAKALQHVIDHVLSAPECFGWALVIPNYQAFVDPNQGRRRLQYAQKAEKTKGESAQGLYDAYAAAIIGDIKDAVCLGWLASSGAVTVTLGTCGVLVLTVRRNGTCRTVQTAFLPGQGSAAAVVRSRLEPSDGFVFRRDASRDRPRARRHVVQSAREQRARQRRRPGWADEHRLYYDVFKPAVQFIRTRYHSYCDPFGQEQYCDYALLKDVLPRRSRLKLEHWQGYRRKCGRGEYRQ